MTLAVFDSEPDVICTLSSASKSDKFGNAAIAQFPDVKLASPAFEWAMICDLVGVESSGITVRTDYARKVGGFCSTLAMSEDREFLIRVSRLGAARILPNVLFEKAWSRDGLSIQWTRAGYNLIVLLSRATRIHGPISENRTVFRDQDFGHAYAASRHWKFNKRHAPLPRNGTAERWHYSTLSQPHSGEKISSNGVSTSIPRNPRWSASLGVITGRTLPRPTARNCRCRVWQPLTERRDEVSRGSVLADVE